MKKPTMDFELSENVAQTLAIQRTLLTFMWIIAFSLFDPFSRFYHCSSCVLLLYLKLLTKERWRVSFVLTGLTFGFFWSLFVWLLDMSFQEGLLLKGLSAFGIG